MTIPQPPPRPITSTTTPTKNAPTWWRRTIARTRSGWRPNTTKTLAHNPVVTRPVVGTPAEIANVLRNPAVIDHGPVTRLTDGRVRVRVRYIDRAVALPPSPRWQVNGGRKFAAVLAAVLGVPAAAYAAGRALWWAYGDAITAATITAGKIALGTVVVTVIAWWFMNHGRNGCPGLHCQGCGGH